MLILYVTETHLLYAKDGKKKKNSYVMGALTELYVSSVPFFFLFKSSFLKGWRRVWVFWVNQLFIFEISNIKQMKAFVKGFRLKILIGKTSFIEGFRLKWRKLGLLKTKISSSVNLGRGWYSQRRWSIVQYW